ncbi:hypothetical protein Tco_0221669 [Tanacetum coccineum]
MKRPTKGYSGQEVTLFPTMLDDSKPSTSPLRITSSPSHSPEPSFEHSPYHTTAVVSFPSLTQPSPTQPSPTQPSPTQPSPTQPSPKVEQHIPIPNESPLYVVHSHRSAEGSFKLNELTTLVTKLFEKISKLEDDLKKTKLTYSATVTKLILRGRNYLTAEVQEKQALNDNLFQEVTPLSIQDQEASENGNSELYAGASKGIASIVQWLVLDEIARDKEFVDNGYGRGRQRSYVEDKSYKEDRLDDPSVIGFMSKMNPKTIAQARNLSDILAYGFSEHGSERMKSPERLKKKMLIQQRK